MRRHGRSTLDLVGSGLVAVGLVGITYALVEVREKGLEEVLPFLVVGVVALVGLVVWTLKARDPVVPPSLLRVPGLASANLVTLVMYAALGAHLLFLPVYLQFLGFSPTLAGLVFAPPSIALILLAPRWGRYADRNGPRLPIAGRCGDDRRRRAPAAAGHGPCRRLDVGGGERLPLRARALGRGGADHGGRALPGAGGSRRRGCGPQPDRGAVGGILSVAAIGALAGAIFVDHGGVGDTPFDPSAEGAVREAGVDAFHGVILSVAGLAFLASVLAATALRGHRQSRTPSSVSSATLRSSPPP